MRYMPRWMMVMLTTTACVLLGAPAFAEDDASSPDRMAEPPQEAAAPSEPADTAGQASEEAKADQGDETRAQKTAAAVSERARQLSIDELYPQGKRSIIMEALDGTDALMARARSSLKMAGERPERFRQALVLQAAAQAASRDNAYSTAMFLTLRARSLARDVVLANRTTVPLELRYDPPIDVKEAGNVDTDAAAGYVEQADERVPELEALMAGIGPITEDEEDRVATRATRLAPRE